MGLGEFNSQLKKIQKFFLGLILIFGELTLIFGNNI